MPLPALLAEPASGIKENLSNMRGTHFQLILLVMATFGLATCRPCDRSGCDALGDHVSSDQTGVAGIVSSESDLVANGCQECPLSQATLQLWRVEAPVPDEATAAALVSEREPDVSDLAQERYLFELEAGYYLLCSRPNCTNIEVRGDETLTVNVAQHFGPTSFFVGRPGEAVEQVPDFEVGY
jgi:hypothetical protein